MADPLHLPALILALLGAALATAGCGEPEGPEARLGVFELDPETTAAALERQGLPQPAARRQAETLRVQLAFLDDGRFELRQKAGEGPTQLRTGTFARSGNLLTLRTVRLDGELLEVPSAWSATLENNELRVVPVDSLDPAFILRRK